MIDYMTMALRSGNHVLVRYKGETVIELVKALETLHKIADDATTIFDEDTECFSASVSMLIGKLKQYAVPVELVIPAELLEEVFDTLDWGDTLCNMGALDHVTEEAIYEARKVTGW